MRSSDSPRYRRTGPVEVASAAAPRRRRLRRRWLAVFAVVLGIQAGWIGTVAIAESPAAVRPSTGSASPSAPRVLDAEPTETASDSTPTATGFPTAAPTRTARSGGSTGSSTGPATTSRPSSASRSADAPSRVFAADSPWNTRIGPGASYSATGSALTRSLLSSASRATINSTAWSVPVAVAAAGDPTVRVALASGTGGAHRMPSDADPSDDSDGELAVIDGTRSYEYWGLTGSTAHGWSARFGTVVDLTGSGTTGGVRASGFSLLGGLIRTDEVGDGIDHALVIALAGDQLHTGPVAPARSQDGDADTSYSGEVHLGQLVAIPLSVDLDALHLSPAGLRLARALQQYGAYVGDRSSQMTLYAEPDAEGPGLSAMRTALRGELAPLLRAVTAG